MACRMGDLIQEGNVGLMKAVKRFDPEHGRAPGVSFAVHWIRAEIHEYVLRNWRLVKVATTKAQRKLFFNLRQMKKNLAWLSDAETQPSRASSASSRRSHRDGAAPLGARPLVRPGAGCRRGGIDRLAVALPACAEADPATQSSRTSGTATSRTPPSALDGSTRAAGR